MDENLFTKQGGLPPAHTPWTRTLEDHESAELVFAGLKDGLIFLDRDGRVSRINPVMEKLLGVTDAEARGKHLDDITGIPEVRLFISEPTLGWHGSFRLKGREFEVEGMEIFAPGGERRGIVTRFQDVTENRVLERQRTELLSMITHDLKAPLSSILGYADLILDGSLGEVSPDIQESVEAMSRGGHKILAIIENYLTLSKLDSGLMRAVIAPTDLVELAGIVISELNPGQNPGRVRLGVEPGFPVVDCDHRLIERALGNLLCNAVKFSRQCGIITLSLKRADEAAALLAGCSFIPGQEYVELSVEDEGMGITKEDLPHVFGRYWRGSRAHGVSGTGLGLSIVKLVAETHGGFVQVESEEDKGSRFAIVIPVRQPLSN